MRFCRTPAWPSTAPAPIAAAAIVMAAVYATAATAQDAGEDPRGGTFAAEPFSHSAEHTGIRTPPAQTDLFESAVSEFENGRFQAAQRLFERVIALDHKNTLADKARRYLADLYKVDQNVPRIRPPQPMSHAKAKSPHPTLPWARRPNDPHATPDDRKTARVKPETRTPQRPSATRVSAALEEQFIIEAGDRIFFGLGSAELGGRARAVINAQARWLGKRPDLDVTIEGYADDPPLLPAQQAALSQKRAEAVRLHLIAEGIAPRRLSIIPWGRERRVSNCDEPACTAQNRRAITVLVQRELGRETRPIRPVRGSPPDSGPFNNSHW